MFPSFARLFRGRPIRPIQSAHGGPGAGWWTRFGHDLPLVHDVHTELRQLRAEAVEIEAELALPQPLARFLLLGQPLMPRPRDVGRGRSRHDDDAIDVGRR